MYLVSFIANAQINFILFRQFGCINASNIPGVYTGNRNGTIVIRGRLDVIFDDEHENHLLAIGACCLTVDCMFPVTFPRGCPPSL